MAEYWTYYFCCHMIPILLASFTSYPSFPPRFVFVSAVDFFAQDRRFHKLLLVYFPELEARHSAMFQSYSLGYWKAMMFEIMRYLISQSSCCQIFFLKPSPLNRCKEAIQQLDISDAEEPETEEDMWGVCGCPHILPFLEILFWANVHS